MTHRTTRSRAARFRRNRPRAFPDGGIQSAVNAFEAAIAEHQRGNLAQAIAAYERLLKEQPRNATALTNLATAHKQAGNFDEALRCFRRALDVDSTLPELWLNYGNLL